MCNTFWYEYQPFAYFHTTLLHLPARSSPTCSSAAHSRSSSPAPKGSRLERKLPENMTGSWGIIEMAARRWRNGTDPVSIPSMRMVPAVVVVVSSLLLTLQSIGARRKRAWIIDDLPAPVRPTMPIRSYGWGGRMWGLIGTIFIRNESAINLKLNSRSKNNNLNEHAFWK